MTQLHVSELISRAKACERLQELVGLIIVQLNRIIAKPWTQTIRGIMKTPPEELRQTSNRV